MYNLTGKYVIGFQKNVFNKQRKKKNNLKPIRAERTKEQGQHQ